MATKSSVLNEVTTNFGNDVQTTRSDLNYDHLLNNVIKKDVDSTNKVKKPTSLNLKNRLLSYKPSEDPLSIPATPVPKLESTLNRPSPKPLETPDLIKLLLNTPQMEKYVSLAPISKSPIPPLVGPSSMNSFKLPKPLNDPSPSCLPSSSSLLINQNLANKSLDSGRCEVNDKQEEESQSNSPPVSPSISRASSNSDISPSRSTSSNGPFPSTYSDKDHHLPMKTPFFDHPITNHLNNLAAAQIHFSTLGSYPPGLPLISNPPRLSLNYSMHPEQMRHLTNPASWSAHSMGQQGVHAISNQVNHFYSNRSAINGLAAQSPNSVASMLHNQTIKQSGRSSSSPSSDESTNETKKREIADSNDDSITDDANEKKRRRNREAAERCRKRKMERFSNLEAQCSQYREQLIQANMAIARLNEKCQYLEYRWNQQLGANSYKTAK